MDEWDYDSAARLPRWREEWRGLAGSWPLIRELVGRDVKVRYRRSSFGVVLSMLLPLSMLVILTVVFSGVLASHTASYPLFVFPGLVAWNFFSQTSAAIVSSPVASADLFRRVRMAKSALAVATLAGGAIQFIAGTALCLLLMIGLHPQLGWGLLTIPAAMVIFAAFTLGWGLLGAALAVDFVDVPNLHQAVMPLLMFATPVVYPASLLPPAVAPILAWNPLAILIELFRRPLAEGQAAPWPMFAAGALLAIVALAGGWVAFTRRIDVLCYRS